MRSEGRPGSPLLHHARHRRRPRASAPRARRRPWVVDGVSYGSYVAARYSLVIRSGPRSSCSTPSCRTTESTCWRWPRCRPLRASCARRARGGLRHRPGRRPRARRAPVRERRRGARCARRDEHRRPDVHAKRRHPLACCTPQPTGTAVRPRRAPGEREGRYLGARPARSARDCTRARCAPICPAPWGTSATPRPDGASRASPGRRLRTRDVWPYDRATARGNGFLQTCLHWPPTPAAPQPRRERKLAVPTLLLNGDRDLSTPLEWARQEAHSRQAGRLVVIPGAGHSIQTRDPSGRGIRALADFLGS